MPLLWRLPAFRCSFKIQIQIHVPRLYVSMFGVGGWKHESMWVCKKTNKYFYRSKGDTFVGSPLLSYRSMWKGKDYCRLLSACIVLTLYLWGQSWQLLAIPISLKQNNGQLIIWKFCALSLSLSLSLSLFLSLSLSQFLPCIDYFMRFLNILRVNLFDSISKGH